MDRMRIAFALSALVLFSAGCGAEVGSEPQSTQTVDGHHRNYDGPDKVATKTGTKPIPSATGPWPELICEGTEHKSGCLPVGTPGMHTFTITNAGKSNLELCQGSLTSNCTGMALSSLVVKPGETADVEVKWVTCRAPVENFVHGGHVWTNDPKQPSVAFAVRGIIDDGKSQTE